MIDSIFEQRLAVGRRTICEPVQEAPLTPERARDDRAVSLRPSDARLRAGCSSTPVTFVTVQSSFSRPSRPPPPYLRCTVCLDTPSWVATSVEDILALRARLTT